MFLRHSVDCTLRTYLTEPNSFITPLLLHNKCKKRQFIRKLTASDTSKTAKITKRWYYPPAHHLNVNLLPSDITFFVIFAVLDVSFAVYLSTNCSFITFLSYCSKTAFLDCLHESFVLTGLNHAIQFLVFFHLNFLFDST